MKELFEMMRGMQRNWDNLAQAIQHIEESNKARDKKNPRQKEPTLEKGQNEKVADNSEKTRQDKASDTLGANNVSQYITLADVAKLIKREQMKIAKVPRQFVRQPSYLSELSHKPYPQNYEVPTFSLYDGRRGNALEHVNKFIDTMGLYASDSELCLHEFSKSLFDKAYSWYITIPTGSIESWEDIVECFCVKYYQEQEEVTLIGLHNTKQRTNEDLLDYIQRFRDKALICHVKYEEHELVEICIDNMLSEY